ncbi:osmotically-inducible protein OsmY [Variovorax sp. GrIS 2.14]|uniref:BON domain-containing protein n=1 Tax=unclassified Variovorax TaxID=663243 RepID=UPI0019A7895E|nr:BON domain-containing protein [Variovorax sp. RTB1]MBC7394260.1 BON domain-containing protein [Variovorax sp.]MEB0110738.1 BON domain-containing protein [Variovorax sp. RTB1]
MTIPTTSTRSIATAMAALTLGAALVAGLSGCVPLVIGGAAAAGAGLVATDRRSSGAQLDDQGIELRGAARIREIANDDMNVTLVSFNRQVLMVGTVGSEADKRRAEEVLRRVDNVRSVVNELVVGPSSSFPQRSNDTYITGKVKASLLDAKDIFANSFKIVTERSTVYIMGIATRRETDRATEITRGVSGVDRVVRVVEIVSDAELANQTRANTAPAPVSSPSSSVAPASTSRSNVPLPPMEPMPAPSGGASTTPVR